MTKFDIARQQFRVYIATAQHTLARGDHAMTIHFLRNAMRYANRLTIEHRRSVFRIMTWVRTAQRRALAS